MWFKMHPWVFPIILGGIGVIYLILNIGAIIETKKIQAQGSDHHISGIPFLGGIHLLIAGLISPIKWLALFCVLDYTFWSFLYAVFFVGCFKKNDVSEEDNRCVTVVKKDRMDVRPVKTSGVGVGDVIVCLMLVVFSVAGFVGRNVILGYLAGVPAVNSVSDTQKTVFQGGYLWDTIQKADGLWIWKSKIY